MIEITYKDIDDIEPYANREKLTGREAVKIE